MATVAMTADERLDQMIMDSFPASDAPSYGPASVLTGRKKLQRGGLVQTRNTSARGAKRVEKVIDRGTA